MAKFELTKLGNFGTIVGGDPWWPNLELKFVFSHNLKLISLKPNYYLYYPLVKETICKNFCTNQIMFHLLSRRVKKFVKMRMQWEPSVLGLFCLSCDYN